MNTSTSTPLVPSPVLQARNSLPFGLGPAINADPTDVDSLAAWCAEHREEMNEQLATHGALLIRGFALNTPEAMEKVALALEPALQNDYLGTSPRDAVTTYVFSASELPGFYPIPQHCEMTFLAEPPRRIFFGCMTAPAPGSGETPLTDFRRVAADLDPAVKERFATRRLRLIRNYCGPATPERRDLWKLKRWDEMFQTTDRRVVEEKCARQGFQVVWGAEDRLTLLSEHDAFTRHPVTGEEVWFNHLQVFHMNAGPDEMKRTLKLRPSLKQAGLWAFARASIAVRKRTRDSRQQAMHMTWADGTEICSKDVRAVQDAIWKNMVIVPWQTGDLVMLDNRAVSHGRLPYNGPRKVLVAWA